MESEVEREIDERRIESNEKIERQVDELIDHVDKQYALCHELLNLYRYGDVFINSYRTMARESEVRKQIVGDDTYTDYVRYERNDDKENYNKEEDKLEEIKEMVNKIKAINNTYNKYIKYIGDIPLKNIPIIHGMININSMTAEIFQLIILIRNAVSDSNLENTIKEFFKKDIVEYEKIIEELKSYDESFKFLTKIYK